MSKKVKQIESKKQSEQYLHFVSPLLKEESEPLEALSAEKLIQWVDSMDNAPIEKQADRRQKDSDLWDALSFRNVTFAGVIAEIQGCILNHYQISSNLMEKYAMCVIRSTFRDLIKKGADEWQTAVYDEFKSDIRKELSRRMASETAYEVNRNRKGDMVRACADGNAKEVLNHGSENAFGSGYDLMHSVIVCLLECIARGYNFSSVIKEVKPRKIVVNPWDEVELVSYETSIVQKSFKACRDEIQRQASIKAVDNGFTYVTMKRTIVHGQSMYLDAVTVDDRDGYADEEIYMRTKQNMFTGENTSALNLKNYTEMIKELALTETQLRRLQMKAKGYSIEQIAGEEKTTRRAIQKSIEQCRKKAVDWLIEKDIERAIDSVSNGTGAEMFSLAEYLNNREEYNAELETDIDTYKTKTAQYLAGKYRPQAMPFTEKLPQKRQQAEREGAYPSWYEMYGPAYKYTKDSDGFIIGIESAE